MKAYNQSQLFEVLVSAARDRVRYCAEASLLQRYKKNRYLQAAQALRTRSVWLYTEGSRFSTVLTSQLTIYTQPAGVRLLLAGYSNNLRYGRTSQPINNAGAGLVSTLAFPQFHRVRIIGPRGERALVDDLVPSQSGISGEACYTQTALTTPEIIEPDEQIAVDLGYDTAGTAPAYVLPEAFTFFCLSVKDKLTPRDEEVLQEVKDYITANDFQRGVYLNCGSTAAPNAASGTYFIEGLVIFDSGVAGGKAIAITRPMSDPLLITGIGTTLNASKIKIIDTLDGYSFSLDKYAQSSAICLPDFESIVPTAPAVNTGVAPDAGPTWTSYHQFAMPYLLRRGASLRADAINGGTGSIVGASNTNIDLVGGDSKPVIYFQGMTV